MWEIHGKWPKIGQNPGLGAKKAQFWAYFGLKKAYFWVKNPKNGPILGSNLGFFGFLAPKMGYFMGFGVYFGGLYMIISYDKHR